MENIEIIEGDITSAKVDAIVNAANPIMLGGGGGGVDGAIHKAAGPKLLEACRQIKPQNGVRCPFGSARITVAGNLKAKHVIHAVGPIYRNEIDPDKVLAQTYTSILELALEHQCKSIAVPAISCGAYGFPIERASRIAVDICSKYPTIHIKFYLIDMPVINAWQKALVAYE